MRPAVLLAVALAAAGCGADRDEPRPPRSAQERRAAAVFERYLTSAARGDAVSVCRYLVARAAARHRCDSDPAVPSAIRRVLDRARTVQVRDASAYAADVHLAAPLSPPTDLGSNLVMFLGARDGELVVLDVFPGWYPS